LTKLQTKISWLLLWLTVYIIFFIFLISLEVASKFNYQLQKCLSFWWAPLATGCTALVTFKNAPRCLDRLVWLTDYTWRTATKSWHMCCVVMWTNPTWLRPNWQPPLCQCEQARMCVVSTLSFCGLCIQPVYEFRIIFCYSLWCFVTGQSPKSAYTSKFYHLFQHSKLPNIFSFSGFDSWPRDQGLCPRTSLALQQCPQTDPHSTLCIRKRSHL